MATSSVQHHAPVRSNHANSDAVLSSDRVLKNMFELEQYYALGCNYFDLKQSDIQPWMRKHVTYWMLEVCKEQECEPAVFLCALNCMDRFLAAIDRSIHRSQLQLLGSACMFVSSKLRQAFPLDASLLSGYTADSVEIQDILDWEKLVLSVLKYDIACVTPHDLLTPILTQLRLSDADMETTAKRAQKLAALCLALDSDFQFARELPSMMAAACICTILKESPGEQWFNENSICDEMSRITGIEYDCLSRLEDDIQKTLTSILSDLNDDSQLNFDNGTSTPQKPIREKQPQTPTDVREIRLI